MVRTKTMQEFAGVLVDEQAPLTLSEVCRACSVRAEFIVELVEEGVIEPQGDAPPRWRFTGAHMRRARTAMRLQTDLGVNLAGAALALQLLDEIEELRRKLRRELRGIGGAG